MHHLRFLIPLLVAFSSVAAELPPPSAGNAEKWEKSIAKFEKSDHEKAPAKDGILFIGSSSIRGWKTLAKDFPELPVYNRGFGGSQIADSILFADRIVIPYRPRQVVMFAGSNDINAGKSPEQVLADFIEFDRIVRAKLPNTRISWIAITPCFKRWSQIDRVNKANRLVREFCERQTHLNYINTADHMLAADGMPRPDIFVADGLHLNAKGYALWTRIVRPFLR
ncbi:MAG: SGNH/GDSL hydrolase family protein [Limisphaerales bacterium]